MPSTRPKCLSPIFYQPKMAGLDLSSGCAPILDQLGRRFGKTAFNSVAAGPARPETKTPRLISAPTAPTPPAPPMSGPTPANVPASHSTVARPRFSTATGLNDPGLEAMRRADPRLDVFLNQQREQDVAQSRRNTEVKLKSPPPPPMPPPPQPEGFNFGQSWKRGMDSILAQGFHVPFQRGADFVGNLLGRVAKPASEGAMGPVDDRLAKVDEMMTRAEELPKTLADNTAAAAKQYAPWLVGGLGAAGLGAYGLSRLFGGGNQMGQQAGGMWGNPWMQYGLPIGGLALLALLLSQRGRGSDDYEEEDY